MKIELSNNKVFFDDNGFTFPLIWYLRASCLTRAAPVKRATKLENRDLTALFPYPQENTEKL